MPHPTSHVSYLTPDADRERERELERELYKLRRQRRMRYRGLNVKYRYRSDTEEYGLDPAEPSRKGRGTLRSYPMDFLPSTEEYRPQLSASQMQVLAVGRAMQGFSYMAGHGLVMRPGKQDFQHTTGLLLHRAEKATNRGLCAGTEGVLKNSRRARMNDTDPRFRNFEYQEPQKPQLPIESRFSLSHLLLLSPVLVILGLAAISGSLVGVIFALATGLWLLGSNSWNEKDSSETKNNGGGGESTGSSREDPISAELREMKRTIEKKQKEMNRSHSASSSTHLEKLDEESLISLPQVSEEREKALGLIDSLSVQGTMTEAGRIRANNALVAKGWFVIVFLALPCLVSSMIVGVEFFPVCGFLSFFLGIIGLDLIVRGGGEFKDPSRNPSDESLL